MGRITELRIGNVRCFEGEQSVKTRRITLLVGENNAGKSTALGCYHALAKMANLDNPDRQKYFDDAPFWMGQFDTIARSASSIFMLGGSFEGHIHTSIACDFMPDKHKIPCERRVQIEFETTGNGNRKLDMELISSSNVLRLIGPDFSFDLDHSVISFVSILEWISRYVRHGYLPYSGQFDELRTRLGTNQSSSEASEFARLITFLRSELPLPDQTSFFSEAIDPLIARRTRTYSVLPYDLHNFSSERLNRLNEIGHRLRIWRDVTTRKRSEDGCYEVLVKIQNDWQNLVDVGYGIHSILPLLTTIVGNKERTTFLLQQPEVHLHPSAQANLAQFMAESEHDFLIETHSDHLVDRFRICVMDGVLRPDEFSIAYFALSPDGKSSQVHNLEVDTEGNLSDVPRGYRSFFMNETKRLLGLK